MKSGAKEKVEDLDREFKWLIESMRALRDQVESGVVTAADALALVEQYEKVVMDAKKQCAGKPQEVLFEPMLELFRRVRRDVGGQVQ